MSEFDPRRAISVGVIIVVGCVTGITQLIHQVTEQAIHAKLLGVWIPFGLSVALCCAGIWLYWRSFDAPSTQRIATWTGLGLLGGIGFGYPVIPYQAAHGIQMIDMPFLVANWLTVGALGGFLIGYYNTRQCQYRAALEEEREAMTTRERELERQNKRLEQFASTLSHDLRSPLTVARGRLTLAQEGDESEHLDAVSRARDRMETLIDDVLALARQGQPIDETESVSLSTMADQCWGVIETEEATLALDGDATFMADPNRLQQLFENLIRNAVEHGGEDVTVRVGSLSDRCGIYIADDGPGIPDDEQVEVFTAGYSTSKDGTGLGLAIIAEIVDAHDWDISVTESDDGGARFEISSVETVG